MSMLRHIRDTRAVRTVTLLYANTSERDIVFRDELAGMERDGAAGLKVVHVLNEPSDEWKGERGRLDEEKIKRLAGPERERIGMDLREADLRPREVGEDGERAAGRLLHLAHDRDAPSVLVR